MKGRAKKTPQIWTCFLQLLERRCCLCSLSLPVFPLLDEIPEYSRPSVYFTWVFYRSHPALSPLEFPVQGHLVLSLLLNEHRQGAPQQTANAFAFTLCSAGSSGSSTAWNIPIPMVFTPSPCLQLQHIFVLPPWSLVNSLSIEKRIFWWKD